MHEIVTSSAASRAASSLREHPVAMGSHAHVVTMEKRHPHADATYRVFDRSDGTFGVEVTIPDTQPTMVTSFATKDKAKAWIAAHKRRVACSASLRGRFWLRKRSNTSKAASNSRGALGGVTVTVSGRARSSGSNAV
jgi:hypothetical protein